MSTRTSTSTTTTSQDSNAGQTRSASAAGTNRSAIRVGLASLMSAVCVALLTWAVATHPSAKAAARPDVIVAQTGGAWGDTTVPSADAVLKALGVDDTPASPTF